MLHKVGHQNSEGALQAGDLRWNDAFGKNGAAKPGDVVELLPGTYTGQRFTVACTGDPANPILIKPPDDATEPAILDGEYVYPTGKAARVGKDGEMVHGGLLDVRSPGVHLLGILPGATRRMIQLTRSRGRGAVATGDDGGLENVVFDGLEVGHCRSLAIMPRYVKGGAVTRCDLHHAGDYYQGYRDVNKFNWPGILALHACEDLEVSGNLIHETWTDGLMLSISSKRIKVHHNTLWEIGGNVACYAHGLEDSEIYQNLMYYTGDPAWGHGGGDFDGAAGIVCNNEEEFPGMKVSNLRIHNNILLNMGLGIWRNEGTAKEIVNVLYAHNTVICHGAAQPLRVAQKTGPRSVAFKHTLFYHDKGEYGDIADWAGILMEGNGWGGVPPVAWQQQLGLGSVMSNVPLKNPDAPLSAGAVDIENYRPTQPCGLGAGTGVDQDYSGYVRKYFTVGALEYIDPPPPPMERISILLEMDVAADKAAMVREVLSTLRGTVL